MVGDVSIAAAVPETPEQLYEPLPEQTWRENVRAVAAALDAS
jgi:hypothetical protein